MGIFTITGTVVAIGQSEFNTGGTFYAFVEFVEPSGRRKQLFYGTNPAEAKRLRQQQTVRI